MYDSLTGLPSGLEKYQPAIPMATPATATMIFRLEFVQRGIGASFNIAAP